MLPGNFLKMNLRPQAAQSLVLMKLRGITLVVKFFLTLFIAQFLSFEELGVYGLLTAFSIVAPSYLGLALMYVQTRKVVMWSDEQRVEGLHYYGRYILSVYFLLIPLTYLIGVYYDKPTFAFCILCLMFLEHLNQDIYGYLLNLSRPLAANCLHFVRSALWMLLYMGIAYNFETFRNIETLILFWISGSSIPVIYFIWMVSKWPWKLETKLMPLWKWVLKEFKVSKVFYTAGAVNSVSAYINHILITYFLGLELAGVYIFYFQITSALSNLIETGIIQTTRPKLVRAFEQKAADFNLIFIKTLKLTVITSITLALIAWPAGYVLVFNLLDKPLAQEWFGIFPIILIIFLLTVPRSCINLAFYAKYQDGILLKLTLFATGLTFLTNLILIPMFGLWALYGGILLGCIFVAIQVYYLKKII